MLTLTISRGETAQVSCVLDGNLLGEFYGFEPSMTDAQIEFAVRFDLAEKGYVLA